MQVAHSTSSSGTQEFAGNAGMQIGGRKTGNRLLDDDFFGIGGDRLCLLRSYSIATDEDNGHVVVCCNQRIDARFSYNLSVDAYFPDSSRVIGVRENGMFSANGAMIADEADTIEASIQAFHHVQGLVLTGN